MWLRRVVVGTLIVAVLPLLYPVTMPGDVPAPARIAPHIENGRRTLLDHQDVIRSLPHRLRYVGARCSDDAVALLFDVWVYPLPMTTGAIAVNGDWPPADLGAFGGAYFVDDFDAGLRDGWITDSPWGPCEPA